MRSLCARFVKDESGATAIEYGLIVALIAVVLVGVLANDGLHLQAKFNKVSNTLN